MSVYYAVGLGRADLRNGELRNVSARRAKERHRFSLLTTYASKSARRRSPVPLLVSKLRSVTVGEDDVITSSEASHNVLARKVVSYRSHGVAARKVEQTPPIGNRELI